MVAVLVATMSIIRVLDENKGLRQYKTNTQSQIKKLEDEKTKLQNEKIPVEELKTKVLDLDKKIEELKLSKANAKIKVASATMVMPVKVEAPSPAGNNETVVWDYLIGQGFTRNQTAGIMGNLQQEHGFQTSGDGLAQWMGGRKARLMAMANPYSLETQLQFLMIELNESCGGSIRATDDVVSATIIFQNKFERCGACNQPNRIRFANEILGRH